VSPDPNDLSRAQDLLGVVVYKSSDGGRTWGAPTTIHPATGDDKQWCAGDISPGSPFLGHVYVTWDGGGGVEFARTTDHGGSWRGTAGQAAESVILPGADFSDISIAADGTVYVVAMAGNNIVMTTSSDGGDSFAAPTTIVSGLTPITGTPPGFQFPVLPGGVFRVLTLPTGCAGSEGTFVVAWADQRDGDTHIYMRRSTNHGASFSGPDLGAEDAHGRRRFGSRNARVPPAAREHAGRRDRLRLLPLRPARRGRVPAEPHRRRARGVHEQRLDIPESGHRHRHALGSHRRPPRTHTAPPRRSSASTSGSTRRRTASSRSGRTRAQAFRRSTSRGWP
jgi:hypothetical protein